MWEDNFKDLQLRTILENARIVSAFEVYNASGMRIGYKLFVRSKDGNVYRVTISTEGIDQAHITYEKATETNNH